MRYAQYLGKTLKQAMEEASVSRDKAIELRDELALLRGICAEVLTMHAAVEDQIEDETKKALLQTKLLSYVMKVIRDVRDMALAAHRLEQDDKIGLESLSALTMQMTYAVELRVRECADQFTSAGINPQEFVDSIAHTLQHEVRLQKERPGVDHTPDQVELMDASVPECEQ